MANITTNYIMNFLFDNDIFFFQPRQFSTLLEIDIDKAYDIIQRLKKNNIIIEVENGKYLVTGYDKKRILSNPFYIANNIVIPSYISYWSALNYYSFTEQVPKYILSATTKQKKETHLEKYTFKYITIKKEKFYGYKKEMIGELSALIAEPEKAIIDSIDLYSKAGGITEIAKSIENAISIIDKKKLIKYASRFPNKSMISRLGYIFELKGIQLKELHKFKSQSFVLLNPKNIKEKRYNKKWNIIINEEL